MVFHGSLIDSKSPQVSRTLLSILAILNNVVVWMVSTRPPTSKSSSPFSNPLVTVPNAPITIGIIITCMFHSFFQFPSKIEVLIFLFTFFHFILWSARTWKSTTLQVLFFLLIIIRSGFLAEIRWSVCMSSPIRVYVCYLLLLLLLLFIYLFFALSFFTNYLWFSKQKHLHNTKKFKNFFKG